MEQFQPILSKLTATIHLYVEASESAFNEFAANIDFTAFCFFYSIILIWFIRKVTQRKIFRPKNKELVGNNLSIQIGRLKQRKLFQHLWFNCQ